jgi:hypothetical protein
MIRFATSDGQGMEFHVFANGLRVYLDNCAIIRLATGDASRHGRFVDTICAHGDLLFSTTNAAELGGPQGKSAEAVKTFLNELGPHWVPVELNPFTVMEREWKGVDPSKSCISQEFFDAYFRNRTTDYAPGSIIDVSKDFFSLGAVLKWVSGERLREQSEKFDALMGTIREYHDRYVANSGRLDLRFRVFNPSQPASFACMNLMKTLIEESKAYQAKKGDGMDFCHAVVGSAFAHFAAFDKQWKRRVESLPQPNGLARVYYEPELDQMVTDIESWVQSHSKSEAEAR